MNRCVTCDPTVVAAYNATQPSAADAGMQPIPFQYFIINFYTFKFTESFALTKGCLIRESEKIEEFVGNLFCCAFSFE
jgi:hypothetical protein